MLKPKFTPEQIAELLSNQYVVKCSAKAITYAKDFKLLAVKQYQAGRTSSEIFKEAGFNLKIIGRDTPKGCLRRWNKVTRALGEAGLQADNRGRAGGRRSLKGLTEKAKIEYLEAQVAYLKAENDFLAELRAKRRTE